MTGTTAVPSEHLQRIGPMVGAGASGKALCPACYGGRLHPYKVIISLSDGVRPYDNVDYLEGWVAVCRGSRDYWETLEESERGEVSITPPCGFSLPMTPHVMTNQLRSSR
jgi:hypothetical protein